MFFSLSMYTLISMVRPVITIASSVVFKNIFYYNQWTSLAREVLVMLVMYYLGYNRASMNKIAIREQKNGTEQDGKRQ
jgi:hypothetical protein